MRRAVVTGGGQDLAGLPQGACGTEVAVREQASVLHFGFAGLAVPGIAVVGESDRVTVCHRQMIAR
jgi:hypothetical protein